MQLRKIGARVTLSEVGAEEQRLDEGSDRSPEQARAFAVFAVLWASATLFHQASFYRLQDGALNLALSVVAFAVLLRPSSVRGVLLLAGLQLIELFVRAPYFSNHWLLTGFVNLTVLVAGLTLWVRHRRIGGGELFGILAPAGRTILIIVYFWGVFHKLNAGFFDETSSCASTLLRNFPFDPFLGLVPETKRQLASIYTTLLIETAIPLCLLVPSTRPFGIAMGVAFHFLLGFSAYQPYYNFASALFALYWLYVSPKTSSAIVAACSESQMLARGRAWLARLPPGSTSFAATVAFAYLLLWLAQAGSGYAAAWRQVWMVYGGACVLFCCAGAVLSRDIELESMRQLLRPRPTAFVIFPLLYMLNAASPYFGGKTEGVLAMYSNLTTEGGESNHYLVTKPIYLLPYQDGVVEILESDSPALLARKSNKRGMTWFEFRDLLHRQPGASVKYKYKGEVVDVPEAGLDPRFASPTPWIARKWLFFRDVELSPSSRCMH
jgi:hypothetical protein